MFKPEELEDPDLVENLNTLKVLRFKVDKYEEIRNQIEGRTPRELMEKISKMKAKIYSIENSLGEDITSQDYLYLLNVTFQHDKNLAKYFKQIGDEEKFKLVFERLPLIIEEKKELRDFRKQNKNS